MADFKAIEEARKLMGLGEEATQGEIKNAYRKLAHSCHPDKQPDVGEDNGERMKRLNKAYKLLVDYCASYKYSFREEDVAKSYPFEDNMQEWKDRWFDSI